MIRAGKVRKAVVAVHQAVSERLHHPIPPASPPKPTRPVRPIADECPGLLSSPDRSPRGLILRERFARLLTATAPRCARRMFARQIAGATCRFPCGLTCRQPE